MPKPSDYESGKRVAEFLGHSERRITVLDADDWIGIYDGDKLVFEGHSIEPVELCRVLGLTARYRWVDELPSGTCPERLSDLEAM